MNEEIHGTWWLPGNEENSIDGKLELTRSGVILNLHGKFPYKSPLGQLINYKSIFGKSSKGEAITLFNCEDRGCSIHSIDYTVYKSKYRIKDIFKGAHIDLDVDLIEYIVVEIPHLQQWMRMSGLKYELFFDKNDNSNLHRITVTYDKKLPEKHVLNNFNIELSVIPTISPNEYSFKLMETSNIKIAINEPSLYKQYIEIINNLERFFAFLWQIPVVYSTLHIKSQNSPKLIAKVTNKDTLKYMESYPNLESPLFYYSNIVEQFSSILQNWFDKAEKKHAVFNLYLGAIYNSKMFLEQQFLSTINAIEVYHRQSFDDKLISEEQKSQILQGLKEDVIKHYDKVLKQKLIDKFQFIDELSLRQRIKSLIMPYSEFLEKYGIDEGKFVDSVIKTRNYFTHYDKRLVNYVLKDKDMYIAIEKLRMIIDIYILYEIGIEGNKIKLLLSESERSKRLKYLLGD